MKYFFSTFLYISFVLIPHADDMVVIKNANVFLGQNGFLQKDILIDEGEIILVEDNLPSVPEAELIDAKGKYVTPGLIVFSALGLIEIASIDQTDDTTSNYYNAGFDPSRAYNPFSQAVRLNRSKGVSSTVHMPGASGFFSGLLTYTKINDGLKQKKQGPLGLFTSYGESYNDSRAATLQFMDDFFNFVRQQDNLSQVDNIQFFSGTNNEYQFTRRDLQAVEKVLSGEIPLVVSVNKATDILNVIRFADRQDINLVLWSVDEGHLVAEEIAQAEVPVILDPLQNIPRSFDSLNSTYLNVVKLRDAGVKMSFYYSQDAGPHNAYLATQSAGNAVAMGLNYNDALMSVTSNASEIFNLVDVGIIAPGYDADIVIWDGDPLELMTNVERVFIDGKDQDLSNRYKELTNRYIEKSDLPNSYRSRK